MLVKVYGSAVFGVEATTITRCVRSYDLAPPLITKEPEIALKSPDFILLLG